MAPPALHADRFLSPTPLRIVIDAKGHDCTTADSPQPAQLASGSVFHLLDNARIKTELIPMMLAKAAQAAAEKARAVTEDAHLSMRTMLTREITRLQELRKVNDHVRPEEISLIEHQRSELSRHLSSPQIRLEAVRLIWKTPRTI